MFRQAYNRSTASGYNKAEIRLQNNETNALTMGLKNWQENALFLKVSTIKKQLKLDADVKNRTRGAYLCIFTTLEYLVECKMR